ncbi:MAG: hypothetical protein QME64_04285 [bacterium]|nr:hypothetical protein [bacterium]
MRKEEYGLAAVGFLLLSLAFPPYFISFLAASALGGLGYLLKSLNEQGREELVRFEKEFRKGYELEHQNLFQEAEIIYRSLIEKYPKFAYIAEERIRWLKEKTEELKNGKTKEQT